MCRPFGAVTDRPVPTVSTNMATLPRPFGTSSSTPAGRSAFTVVKLFFVAYSYIGAKGKLGRCASLSGLLTT